MATKSILEEIKKLTTVQLAELVKSIEDEFGVSATPAVAAVAAPAAGGAAAEEKSEFKVTLKEMGSEKIKVIKALRVINSELGLKEAKEAAESAPYVVKDGVPKEEAEKVKKALEEAGATVELS
ncbi:50S ribosomal protein L7/L12 [bacterium]|jgi:large subunit ribosomal protein L7/L12|nr:50S ribosomal protein L7/L12 [bacterium]